MKYSRAGRGARAVFACLFVLSATACGRAAPAKPAPFVETAVASFGSIAPSETLAGIVAPYESIAVQSDLSEPADDVYVQEGDDVRKGQLIARLDTADLEAQLNSDLATANSNHANTVHTVFQGGLNIAQGVDTLRSDKAAVEQASQTLTNDTKNLERDQQLLAQGYVSQQAVDQQETMVRNDQQGLNSANATLAAAQSNVVANGSLSGSGLQASAVQQSQAQEQVAFAQADQVRVQIGKAAIYSPIDGVVVNRNLNPGEYPGTRQIFTLQQIDPVYAVLHASGEQVASLQVGADATVTASQLGASARFAGRVVGVLNQINPGSTDFEVKVVLPNRERTLRPGMAVSALVQMPAVRGVRVPTTAFTDDNHNALMTVAADDTVKTASVVEVGSASGTSIVTGITPGTRVVSDGQSSVGDGEKISYR